MTTNRYIDTRGACPEPVSFTEAVVGGLAQGGGLYVPESIPAFTLDEICDLTSVPYAQQAARVYRAFGVDLDDEVLERIANEAYGNNFDTPTICPVVSLDDTTHVLELWHGPTSAFKDMALQCLPRFFSASARALRAAGKLDVRHLILVATSGDTGKAALAGFAGVDDVSIGVLYPDGGVSDIQFKQMATQRGNNVAVWGVRGNFDDCQTGAKNVFGDVAFTDEMRDRLGIALSSANSINWGRLMPQIVYYLSAYAELVSRKAVAPGDPIDICVPTGNFGNILAAYYAKRIGAPVRMLLCASNENRVLADFINTGTYDIVERPFVKTPSPSMDILVSSNLERQLFELTGRDATAIAGWMDDLKRTQAFRVDRTTFARMCALFAADSASNGECLATIKDVFDRYGYLMDPHTAVAFHVAENLRENDVPVLIAGTAHWAKFGTSVYRALHGMAADSDLPAEVEALTGCALNKLIARETGCDDIPRGLAELDDLPVRFTEVIENGKESIEEAVRSFLNNLNA